MRSNFHRQKSTLERQKRNENKNGVNKQTKGREAGRGDRELSQQRFVYRRKPASPIAALHMHAHFYEDDPQLRFTSESSMLRVHSFENGSYWMGCFP